MSLRVIYGRAGSGKTSFCLNEIKTRLTADATKPLILLVPEQFTFQAERDLIAVLKTGGILEAEVLSFRRLAFRIFNEAGGITYPHIHSSGKCIIIYRILEKMEESYKEFFKSADRKGFVKTLDKLITEFKRYNVAPEALLDASERLDEDNPLKDKLKVLNFIYDEFQKTIEARYRDAEDDLAMASEKLASTNLFDGAEIWVDGFDGFTPQEFNIIGRLLLKAERVNITFCADSLREDAPSSGLDVFSGVKTAYRKIEKIADENAIRIETPVLLGEKPMPRFSGSLELAHLERNFSAYPYEVFNKKTDDLFFFSSVNVFSEIEAASRDIIRLCRDENYRFRDIAVVTRNLAGYEKLIEVIFTGHGIPYFIDRKIDISNHPLIRMILSMLEIFNENWSYDTVFRYLKTGMTGIDQESIDQLENYVLACGIHGSRWTNEQDWNLRPDLIPDQKSVDEQSRLLESINKTRELVAAPLMEFRMKTKGRKKVSEFCAALYDFLCLIGVPKRIEGFIENFRKKGDLALANQYSQVWNIVMEVFDQAVEVMAEETIGIERFSNILEIGFSEYTIGLIPASLDQVLVGSVDRSRSHEIKALFILGVNDGIFPSSAVEEGIFSDQDRKILNKEGIELASDTRTKAFDEQFLVYRALTAAGKYLRISWSLADSEGKAMRPSIVISRLRKLFPQICESSNILPPRSKDEIMELVSTKATTFEKMVLAIRQMAGHMAGDEEALKVWQEIYRWFTSQEIWKERCQTAYRGFRYKNVAQNVSGDKVLALYGEQPVSSVSRLEKYASCPFAFYAQYGLRARERKVFRLSPPDVGTFIHLVIEKFSRAVSESQKSWKTLDIEWCREKISEIIDDMLNEMQDAALASSKRYTALIMRLKRAVATAVWLIANHIRRSNFNPDDFEVAFGDKGKYPPITINLDSGEQIHLTGRIDRIDTFKTDQGTYLLIIDYKSGSKSFNLSDLFDGLQIQLITYLDAVWENRSSNEVSLPGGILYFKVDDPIIRGGKISKEEVELAIMKQLKMRGLLLADVKLIKEMDNMIDGTSPIIPASVNKGDVLGKNSSVATMEQFELLRKYVRKLLKKLCTDIIKGDVSIKPYKKKNITSCRYCSYLSVCQFDTTMKENSYNLLYDKKDEEVWDLITKDVGTHGS